MHKTTVFIHAILAISLVIMLLGSTFLPASAGNKELKADPRLLELAAAHPDDVFHVIVQKDASKKDLAGDDPEVTVESAGGQVDRNKKMDFIASFAAELTGKEIEKLARHPKIHWVSFDAPVFPAGGFGSYTFRDDFSTGGYSGSNGSENWSGRPWTEIGEIDGAGLGKVKVLNGGACAQGNCLRIGSLSKISVASVGVSRKAALTQVTDATLTFTSQVQVSGAQSGRIYLQISPNYGFTWTTLDTFSFITSDSAPEAKSYDISAYGTPYTMLRFIGDGYISGYLYVDDVQISYSRLSNSYVRSILADNVWSTNATPGAGVTVAVVDSGIAPHGDLYTGSTSRIVASVDFSQYSGAPTSVGSVANDDYGHGTHVAGIIAGMGQASQGARDGNAPYVNLVNVKVTGVDGSGYLSNLIAGLQWVYDNHNAYNIKVVNISMNSGVPEAYNASPIDAAVEILWFNGITVVVSAGNNGTGSGPVPLLPPANDPFVITVGAADDMGTPSLTDDAVTTFSAYGTTEDGFAKPELVAPGRNIISLLASTTSSVYVNHQANRVDDYYFRMSGTSMAAPMVSGAVALMLQQNPNLNPDQIKFRLMNTANKLWPAYDTVKAGAGYLDAFAAVYGNSSQAANTGIKASQLLSTGSNPITWNSVGWNSVGWNSVGWNSVGWNSVGWNSVGWNSVGWNSVGWNSQIWDP